MGSQVPLWAALAVAVGAPLLAFLGALVGQLAARLRAKEVEVRWRREEAMRLLRWASDLAVAPEPSRADVGVAALEALDGSELLHNDDRAIVSAVFHVVLESANGAYDEGDAVEEVG